MSKKFEIPREIEDALRKANVPEDAITKLGETADIQSIPLEALDGVAGGAQGTVDVGGVEMSADDFNNLFLTLAETCGFDVALDVFKNYCGGFTCDLMIPGRSRNTAWNSDKDLMGEVLYRYWAWRETGSPYAHP